jgi:uncharacterized protein (TIGR02246 family)
MVAAFLLAACGGGAEVSSPGVSPELKHSWEVSFNKGDADAVAKLYSDRAELVMSGSSPVHGRDAIHKAVDDMIKSGVKVQIGSAQNVGSGDLAYVYGPYSVIEHDGGKIVEAGTYVEVWRRRGGTWQIDLDVNSTGPAMTPAVEPASEGAPQ